MKKLSLLAFLLTIIFLVSCEEDGGGITSPKIGKTLADTTLNVSTSGAVVSIDEGVTVTIPQGFTSSTFNLTIREVDGLPDAPDMMNIHKVFDIECSIGKQFDKNLTVRFDVEPGLFEGKENSDFAAGFYNTSEKKWQIFPSYKIDRDENYIEFQTNHLTTVGYIEFITSGGYAHKFIGDGITVYYSLKDDAPMSWSEYQPSDQDWHLPSGDKNWAPVYIQDIAHYTAEAREIFSESPYDLNVSEGNINIYVKNLKSGDGEYGSMGGALYLKNKMQLPNNVTGVKYEDVLKATCAHELMHLIQDNYYVMNKGKIGLWWMEATATQADWMVWGNALPYTESEIYSIESNAALLETLSKSWDDCNSDPNWYLSGCFLQYLSHYREGSKLNIASAVKAGGSNTASLIRVILNNQIKSELGSNLWDEYHDYVLYLFAGGNEKLSAFPYNKDFNNIASASSLTKQIKMSKKGNTQAISVSLPYLSTRLISVSNLENSKMRINYNLSEIDDDLVAYLFELDPQGGKLNLVDHLYEGKTGDIDLEGRTGGDYDNFVILLINTGFTEGKKEAKLTFKTSDEFQEFKFIDFEFMGADGDIKYSNGMMDNQWLIGTIDFYNSPDLNLISRSFAGNKVNIKFEKTKDWEGSFQDVHTTTTVTGEYNSSEFIYLNLKEETVKYDEVWSDSKNEWVKHEIKEFKEFEYKYIPFFISENDYGIVYTFSELDKSIIKSNLQKLSHTVTKYDEDGGFISEYSLEPIDWDNLSWHFKLSMTTTK